MCLKKLVKFALKKFWNLKFWEGKKIFLTEHNTDTMCTNNQHIKG